MISMAQADHFHELCRTHGLSYVRAEHSLFEAFSEGTTRLGRSLEGIEGDDSWDEFMRALRRYRFELSASPRAFNDATAAPRMDANELNRFVATALITHPSLAGLARAVADLLILLTESADNPLLAAIAEILSGEQYDRAGVVVAESRLVQPTKFVLKSLPNNHGVDVTTSNGLRGSGDFDLLVIVGAVRWFPEYVFSAPQASTIEVVSYTWLHEPWRRAPTFLAPSIGQSVRSQTVETVARDRLEDVGLEFDWATVETQSARDDYGAEGGEFHDLLEARLYALQDGYAVFLEATGRRTTLAIDLDADEDERVTQLADDDIELGMFVVLRNDESGDYIAPVADRILGSRAASYRADHARWKHSLRDYVRRYGLEATSRRLLAAGSTKGEETNLRNWISERNIAPRKQSDFTAITQVIGLGDESERLWLTARAIRNAHMRAGATIRRELIQKVRAADRTELETRGRMDFELPEVEGGRLTAFRVEGRSKSTTLQAISRIERPFEVKD